MTPVEREFLRLWLPAQPRRLTLERFAEAFGWTPGAGDLAPFEDRSRGANVKTKAKARPNPPKSRAGWLTPEREAWLREHYEERPLKETLALFSERFGLSLNYSTLNSANKRCRFGRIPKTFPRSFTPEEGDWLKERLPTAPRREIQDAFEARFGRRPKLCTLDNWATRYGLRGAPNAGRFYKGQPYNPNSGMKGPNSTSFKRGHRNNPEEPLYAERVRFPSAGKQGRGIRAPTLMIKVPGPSPYESHKRANINQRAHWIPKARYVWEQAHGPAPDGMAVVCRDGDSLNCALDNLELVSRGVLARMNAHHAPAKAGGEGAGEINAARLRLAQLREGMATAAEGRTA